MTAELERLLQRAVPEPPHTLDAGALLTAARRRQRVRAAGLAVAAAVLAVLAIGLPQLVGQSRQDAASVPVRLSALDQRVPLGPVAAGMTNGVALAHPGEGSLVATVDNYQVFLVETTNDQVCLLIVRESYGSAARGCQPRSDLLTTGLVFPTRLSVAPSAPQVIFVAVPDGYTRASAGGQTADVANNLAVFHGDVGKGDLKLSGPSVPTATFDLDNFI